MDEPHVDDNGTSQHVWITCPHCHRSNLRIKRANLGRLVVCKHCEHQFRAKSSRDPSASVAETRPAPKEPPASPGARASEEHELRHIGAKLVALSSERDAALQQLAEARAQLDETRGRLHDFQEQLDQALGRLRQAEAAHGDLERLRAEVEDLRGRAADAARLEGALAAQTAERDAALQQLAEARERLGQIEGLREELEGLRADHQRLRAEAEGLRGRAAGAAELEGRLRAELQAAQTQLERIDLGGVETAARELVEVRAERDRLRVELRDREADRQRLAVLTDEVETIRAERDRLDGEVRAVAGREEQLQARVAEVERRAAREREESEVERRAWQERLDAARLQLERETPPLREEAGRFRDQVEELVRERDAALGEAEALGAERDRLAALLGQAEDAGREAARHEAEASRLARAVAQGRVQFEALARRNEELARQADASRTELDRLRRDHEEELREYRGRLEALRHDREVGLAEAAAARERAEAAAAGRADLEARLARFEARIRAADERAERLEAELKARRDRIAELESAGGLRPPSSDPDREADEQRIEGLTAELDEARAANGRLRALLGVFGLPDHLGSGTDLAPRLPQHPTSARGPGSH